MKLKKGIAIFLTVVLSGCSSKSIKTQPPSQGQENTVSNKPISASTKMSEHKITTDSGGTISIKDKNGRFDIAFTTGAVNADRVFEVASIESMEVEAKDYLAMGFYLSEKGTTTNVELEKPASICYTTSEEIPQGSMIVKYSEDFTSYTPIPTQQAKYKGQTCLIALVQSFSGYGVKTLTKEEIDRMGDELYQKGLNWELKVDDQHEFVQNNAEDGLTSELKFITQLKLSMINTKSPSTLTMQGPYIGTAGLSVEIDITVDNQTFYSNFTGETGEEKILLYPVPKVYEATGGGLELVSLIPDYYIGTGKLHFQWEHENSNQTGTDVVNIMSMFGASGPLDNQTVTFTVQTSGPFAKVTLLDFNRLGPMEFQGIIVGQGKEQPKKEPKIKEPKIENELEIAPLTVKSNSDGSISIDENNDGANDMTVCQREDGSYSYDMDGDSIEDLILFPLKTTK